ncbi:MAG TPA: hypothetical protein VEA44_18960 [Caulobacter sp.]|nr:hypothetical protein [Caulobacter sp.]
MSLSAPVFAVALWLAFAAAQAPPAPMPPIEAARQTAPAEAGKCMWEQFPQEARTAVLNHATLEEVYAELAARAQAMGNDGITAAGRACRLSAGQFRSAGSRVADWVGRVWAEKQLAGRLGAVRLDQTFKGMAAADKLALRKAFATQGAIHQSPAKEAFDRYLAGLGIRREEADAFAAAAAYLITRLNAEE